MPADSARVKALFTESTLLDLLSPAYAVDPRNTELAQKHGKKLVSALNRINDYLAGLTPARAPVSSSGRGVAELEAAMSAQPVLAQALEDAATAVSTARSALRTAATNLDRLNKRFYAALKAEARSHALLADALAQISIAGDNHPATLSIRSLVQGGTDDRQVLINYVGNTYDGSTTSSVEWLLKGVNTGFAHSVAVDPSGNAIGPFTAGQTVQLRTRVRNANGSTTGSVRTLTNLKEGVTRPRGAARASRSRPLQGAWSSRLNGPCAQTTGTGIPGTNGRWRLMDRG
jgi:hypothetical protein